MLSILGKSAKNLLPKGYELKSGNITPSAANADSNIIPLVVHTPSSGPYGWDNYIKYGDDVRHRSSNSSPYTSNINSSYFLLIDIDKWATATKKTLTCKSTYYNDKWEVVAWLEKTGGVIRRLITTLTNIFNKEVLV